MKDSPNSKTYAAKYAARVVSWLGDEMPRPI
jgi:hypothetical protein